jgi:hypothetical protein
MVFLNSPYRETPKNVLKKVKKTNVCGWLVPRELSIIKYTPGSVVFVFVGPLLVGWRAIRDTSRVGSRANQEPRPV